MGLLSGIIGHLRVSIGIGGLMVVVPGTVSRRDRWSRKQQPPTLPAADSQNVCRLPQSEADELSPCIGKLARLLSLPS